MTARTLTRRVDALEKRPALDPDLEAGRDWLRRYTPPERRMLALLMGRAESRPAPLENYTREHFDALDRLLCAAVGLYYGLAVAAQSDALVTLDGIVSRLGDCLDGLAENVAATATGPDDLEAHTVLKQAAEAARPYCPPWKR